MKTNITNILVFIAKTIVIGMYSLLISSFFFTLLYIIINMDLNLINNEAFKSFLITYFTVFFIYFKMLVLDDFNSVNTDNEDV